MKEYRYIVYRFPSLYGSPKGFKTYIGALLYALANSIWSGWQTFELLDTKTDTYKAFWI